VATVAHGYIYANDEPCAVYFLDWCERHGERRRAFVTITLGDWDGASTGADARQCASRSAPTAWR